MATIDFRSHLIIRWPDPQPSHIPLLRQIGIEAVIVPGPAPDPAFANAAAASGLAILTESELKTFPLSKLPATHPGPYAALSTGRWPGISRGPNMTGADVEIASASREPWVDSNAYAIAYLRALYPGSAPVLAYEANEAAGLPPGRIVPFETLILALAEARVMGGNYILSLDPQFRKALLSEGNAKALTAWKQLGVTAKWLAENKALFGLEPPPIITELVEPGLATAEIANLLFRRNASPRLVAQPSEILPAAGTVALVTTAIKPPSQLAAGLMLERVADSGVTLVTDDHSPNAWWRSPQLKVLRTQSDRVFYSYGKGTIVAYKQKIVDPSEHALDIIDIVGHPHRAVRIWNANSTIAVSTPGLVHLLNYSARVNYSARARGSDTQVRIQGVYKSATLLRPGSGPLKLEASRRGTTTEVFVPDLATVGTVVFR